MKNTAKHIIISTYLLLFVSLPATAQIDLFGEGINTREPSNPFGDNDPGAPIDSLLIILLLAGIVLGYWYFMRTRNKATA